MSENDKPNVDTNSAEFRQGAEGRPNSDRRNRQAGNTLDQELKNEVQIEGPTEEVPLFLTGDSEGPQGNAQDEKDSTEE